MGMTCNIFFSDEKTAKKSTLLQNLSVTKHSGIGIFRESPAKRKVLT